MKDFKAGKQLSQGSYKSFQPEYINRRWTIENMSLIDLLSQADRHIGRLDMFSDYIPNIDLFISMHVLKEATQSSKIEGTKTNVEDALRDKDDVEHEKRNDWEEVQNYIGALNTAINDLESIPFSTRLIRNAHKVLMHGVRGEHKTPGEFRRSQNWIGGASIKDAVFVPPIHNTIHEYMSDLEKFVHDEDFFFPDLLKIALIHYQFETIHPFLDGNGRVGRLMITLYLVEKGILKKPILYLSEFFEKNRSLYYHNLNEVRTQDNLLQWFKFFLVGIIETAKKSIATFKKILALQEESQLKVQSLGSRSAKGQLLLKSLFNKPMTNVQQIKEVTELSKPSVYKLIEDFERFGILQETSGLKRNKSYLFKEYASLFE